MPLATFTWISFSSIPGNSAVTSYAFSVSVKSTAGATGHVTSRLQKGTASNMEPRGDRQLPTPKSSNRRSISRRRFSNGCRVCTDEVDGFSVLTVNLVGSAMAYPPDRLQRSDLY